MIASPVAAKRGVEDEIHIHEVGVNIAPVAPLEEGLRRAPAGRRQRVRCRRGGQAGWDSGGGAVWEEPDFDVGRGPLGRVDAAAAGPVEARAERRA